MLALGSSLLASLAPACRGLRHLDDRWDIAQILEELRENFFVTQIFWNTFWRILELSCGKSSCVQHDTGPSVNHFSAAMPRKAVYVVQTVHNEHPTDACLVIRAYLL